MVREDRDGIRRLTKHYLELRGERRYRWNKKTNKTLPRTTW